MSVERVNKDEDKDENVDADQTRTGRPVSGQPTGLLTQEIGKDVLFGRESTNSRTGRPVNDLHSARVVYQCLLNV